MKRINWLIGVLMLGVIFSACQKEVDTDGIATGKFQKDAAGNCAPIAINGIFRVDSVLGNDQYVDVQVVSDNIGTFDIKTDTINGYAFSKTGTIGLGLNTIRLFAGGKPLAAGTNTFTIEFGTSICTFDVTVFGTTSGTAAIFTLGGSPGNCTGFTLGGAYNTGVATDPTNFANFVVNVTTLGTYNITTNTVNGLTFSGAGIFSTTGIQGVTLKASGVPAATGSFNYLVSVPTGTCSYSVTVGSSGAPTSVFTLGATAGACTSVALTGVYQQSVPLTGSNTATINVNVTTAGTYAISTTAANGVTFAGSGTFAGTGAQTVVLTGSGTPAASVTTSHTINAATGNCSFFITYAPPPPPAAYTIDCPATTVSGTYTKGVALTASNTVSITANVTTPGQYTLTTTLNGMTFSKTGVFAAGSQTVTLNGTGTPTVTGTNTFTINGTSGSCTFDVEVDPAPTPSDLKWQFTVGGTTYQGDCTATQPGTGDMIISSVLGDFVITLKNPSGAIGTGAYSGNNTSGKHVPSMSYSTQFVAVGGPPSPTNLGANVSTYNITTNIIEGTFSGSVVNVATSSIVTVTNGKFKAQF